MFSAVAGNKKLAAAEAGRASDLGVVATGPTGGGTVPGQLGLRAQLSGARDWVRVLFTPTLNPTSADTANVVAVMLFAGASRLPAQS